MKFQRDQFNYSNGYLTYGAAHLFIARFKSGRKVGGSKSDFVRLLSKYYTIESWTTKAKSSAPLKILMDDGFIQFDPDTRKFLIVK